jgi:hypothetical protein
MHGKFYHVRIKTTNTVLRLVIYTGLCKSPAKVILRDFFCGWGLLLERVGRPAIKVVGFVGGCFVLYCPAVWRSR